MLHLLPRSILRLLCPALFAVSALASAHAHLKSAVPAPEASGPAPHEIRIEFSEQVEPRFSRIQLFDGAGHALPTGAATVAGHDAKVLVAPLAATLPAGAYRVEWHVVATDTHKSAGHYRFTVKAP